MRKGRGIGLRGKLLIHVRCVAPRLNIEHRMNLGRGRKVYGDILLHESVKLRENDPSMNYTPKTSWTGVSRWVRKSFAGGEAGTEPETLV
jgi:hypothetical protein